jgi:pimeloyl-ACP methyl ester carboxylesterase
MPAPATRRVDPRLGKAQEITLTAADGVPIVATYHPAERTPGATGGPGAILPADPAGRAAPVVVVAHGFTGSSRSPAVRRITDRLAEHDLSVLALDFRGHGRSGGRSTAGDLEVQDLAAAVAHLREQGHDRIAVLGWSMGGSVVLRYAGLGGDADAVVSVSSPATWFERGTRSMRVVHWLCETRSGRLTCRIARRTRLAPDAWAVVPHAPVEVVGNIAPTPLLMIHGSDDHYFPVRHAHALAAAAPTADAWIETGMGHAETGTQPELVDRMARWVRAAVAAPEVCDDGPRD